MNCGNCGAPLNPKEKFCGNCGALVPKKKGNKLKIIIPIVVAVAIIGGGVFALFNNGILGNNDDKTSTSSHKDKDDKPTKKPKKTPTPTEEPTATPTEEPTPTEVPESTESYRTIMIYMIGSNLESEGKMATGEIYEMLEAEIEDGTNVIIQTGGCENWSDPKIEDGKVQRWSIVDNELIELDNLGVVNMSDKDNFQDFLEFSSENYPAENYTLVLWDHGGGTPLGFGWDDMFPNDYLKCYEIGDALEDADMHCDAFVTNACLMCSLEMFMSIKDNVDYAVAAETVLLGTTYGSSGIDYSHWLALASQQDVSTQDYCEAILDDYIDYLHSRDWTGSMSVIRMDRIQEVYDSYVDYITDINNNFDYVSYSMARKECGEFEDTDSVDISELASCYATSYSTALQNAVSNAVVRTKSDYPSGHGITAYSPFDYVLYYVDEGDFYTLGRQSFTELNYDSNVIEFYDKLVSRIYYENDVAAYAGSWYIAPDGTTISNDYQMDQPEVIAKNSYYAVDVSSDDWGVIKSVLLQLFLMDDDGNLIRIGVDKQYETDSDGDIICSAPDKWLSIGGYLPSSASYKWEETNDGWYKSYYAAATVDGVESVILIYCNQDSPEGYVIGYADADFETWEVGGAHTFTGDEEIVLYQLKYDSNMNESYEAISPALSTTDLTIEWNDPSTMSDYDIYVNYYITDIYGNTFQTEICPAS